MTAYGLYVGKNVRGSSWNEIAKPQLGADCVRVVNKVESSGGPFSGCNFHISGDTEIPQPKPSLRVYELRGTRIN